MEKGKESRVKKSKRICQILFTKEFYQKYVMVRRKKKLTIVA